jgi:hypothetical protein
MCNARVGLCGADCRELCSEAVQIIIVQAVNVILALSLLMASMYFMYRGFRKLLLKKWDPMVATMVLIGLSSFLWVVEMMVAYFNTVGFRDYSIVLNVNGRFLRRMPVATEVTTVLLYAIAAIVGAVGLFVLPLAWVRFELFVIAFPHPVSEKTCICMLHVN